MTPTSSERAPDARFRTALIVTVVALAALCAAFAALTLLQGPKLSSAQVDARAAITAPGQALRLFANTPVAEVSPSAVSITPALPFSVTTDGKIIGITFDLPLRYATDYTVSVAGVTSVSADQPSTLSYAFTTPAPSAYYLDRGETTDEIVRTRVAGNERTVVYSAPGIQNFALLGTSAVVSTDAGDGTSSLSLVSFDDGGVEPLALPVPGTIERLQSATDSGTFGFTFSSQDGAYVDTLMTLNLDAGRDIVPAAALDGSRLDVANWLFLPNGVSLVAQNLNDDSLLMLDTATGTILPLGTVSSLESLSTDGTTLGVTNPFGPVVLTLADLDDTEFAPSPIDGATPFPGEFQSTRDGLVQHVVLVDYQTDVFENLLVFDDGKTSRELYRTIDDAGSIGRISVSPNDQFVAVEVVPNVETSVSDGRTVDPRSTSITTVFVSVETGAIVKSVAGFALQW